MDKVKNLIIGAGPAGLGAAWRLNEQEEHDWLLVEKSSKPGGLSTSFVDKNGFTWDIGGHVLFSHYKYFDNVLFKTLKEEWVEHDRESWVWIDNRFVPYPFQNNIHGLSKEIMWECLRGIIEIYKNPPQEKPNNFKEWARQIFGNGVCKYFMEPYNFKVWAYPMEKLSYSWIGERVAVVDLEKVVYNIIHDKDDLSWGPNNKFLFPLYAGTGNIWQKIAQNLPQEKIKYNCCLKFIDSRKKVAEFSSGEKIEYENLISTVPVDLLINNSDIGELKDAAKKLKFSSVHVVGVGLRGKTPEKLKTKCWMYFPENNAPFYRVTVFSNYSPNNVPDRTNNWSLMCEVSESPEKKVDKKMVMEDVIEGLKNTKLISGADEIVSTWYYFAKYGYPTPCLLRDEALQEITPIFESKNIYSCGRFGAWKYEIGNMDHSFIQGVKCVENINKKEGGSSFGT